MQNLIPLGVLDQPVGMAVTPDGRVFVGQRNGVIIAYNPTTGGRTTAATLSVYFYTATQYDVGGIWAMSVSPNFASDNWLYVYYTPLSTKTGGDDHTTGRMTNRLSRFQILAGNTLDLASEQTIIDIPSIWETHNGASAKFGMNADLYLSLGDNDAASCSNQYSPMDERAGYSWCDDQRSTANTNSLNGKVLRIHPVQNLVNGKYYTIPAGNLFPPGTALTLPEIYTMGHRNPYHVFPDPVTGRLYIPMFGPAAPTSSARGPSGADIIEVTDSAANFGYPYFLKNLQPYCHWNYATGACIAIQGQTSLYYDPARPVNYSPNNTGLNLLPPAKPAVLWEHDGADPDPVTGLKGCGWGAGPVYHYNPSMVSAVKFPPFFNDKWFFYGIGSGYQPKLVSMLPPPAPVAPIITSQVANAPWGTVATFSGDIQDMAYGPGDGAMYVLDYGGTPGFYAHNTDAGLRRITYGGCLPTPVLEKPRTELLSRAGMSVFAGQNVEAPLGAKTMELFGVDGKKILETDLRGRISQRVEIPASLGSGLLWVRFR